MNFHKEPMMLSDLTTLGDADACLARLDASRIELLTLAAALDDAAFTWRRDEESWSVGMVLEHVAMVEHVAVRMIRVLRRSAEQGTVLPASAEAPRWRPDGRAIAPDAVTPTGEIPRAAVMESLLGARAALREQVASSGPLLDAPAALPTPYHGSLNGLGWLRMAAAHERWHLDQARHISHGRQMPATDSL